MYRRQWAVLGVLACFIAAPNASFADDSNQRGTAPLSPAWSPLVTDIGHFDFALWTYVGLSADAALKPIAFAPDVSYGLAKRFDVSLVHSSKRRTGFVGGNLVGGLCVTGSDGGCRRFYDQPGLLARYLVSDGRLALAGEAGLLVISISDPFAVSLKLGVALRYGGSRIGLRIDPNIAIGMTAREQTEQGNTFRFNQDQVAVPLWLGLRVTPSISVGIETGIRGFLSDFGNTFETPVMLSATARVHANYTVGVTAGFETLIDHSEGKSVTIDRRSLAAFVQGRL